MQNFRIFVFVKRTFRNAFKKCEIVSFELEIILDSLKAKINETRTKKFVISFSLFNECLQRTSRESQSHKRNIQILRVYYVKHENFNVNSRQMLCFLKNNEFQFHTLQLHTRDLNNVFEIIVKRDSRVNISIWRVDINDIIYVHQCKEQISNRLKKTMKTTKQKTIRKTKKIEKTTTKIKKIAKQKIIKKTTRIDKKTTKVEKITKQKVNKKRRKSKEKRRKSRKKSRKRRRKRRKQWKSKSQRRKLKKWNKRL